MEELIGFYADFQFLRLHVKLENCLHSTFYQITHVHVHVVTTLIKTKQVLHTNCWWKRLSGSRHSILWTPRCKQLFPRLYKSLKLRKCCSWKNWELETDRHAASCRFLCHQQPSPSSLLLLLGDRYRCFLPWIFQMKSYSKSWRSSLRNTSIMTTQSGATQCLATIDGRSRNVYAGRLRRIQTYTQSWRMLPLQAVMSTYIMNRCCAQWVISWWVVNSCIGGAPIDTRTRPSR